MGFLLAICRFYSVYYSLYHSPFIICFYPFQSQISWAISSAPLLLSCSGPSLVAMGALVRLSPQTKLQPPNWNMKYYKTVEFCQFAECQAPQHKCKASRLKTFWTIHWNIYETIQSYFKQPVSLLGFKTAQSCKSLLWPGCSKWNGQHIAAILVVSSTILTQHGFCLTSETMRLLKCSEIKINSVTAIELLWWKSQSRSFWPTWSIKVCKEAIFDSLSLFSKPNKSDVRAQLPC